MRTDVKVGIVLSMGLVLVVGGYFLFRAAPGEQSQVTDAAPVTLEKQAASPSPKTHPRNVRPDGTPPGSADATRQPRVMNPRSNAASPDSGRMAANPNQPTGNAVLPKPGPASPVRTDASPTGQPSVGSPSNATAPSDDVATRLASRGFTLPGELGSSPAETTTPLRTDTGPGSSAATANFAPPGSGTAGAQNQPNPVKRDATGATETHRAQQGDTLVSLAQAYYGSAAYLPLLRDANPQVSDPTRLTAGTTIVIPPVPAGWQPQSTASAPTSPAGPRNQPLRNVPAGADARRTYTVKAGDSFYRIAEQQLGNANRWKELLTLNAKLVNGDPMRLRPGQVVVLPGS